MIPLLMADQNYCTSGISEYRLKKLNDATVLPPIQDKQYRKCLAILEVN